MLIDMAVVQATNRRWKPFCDNVESTQALGVELVAEAHPLMNAATAPERLSLFFLARGTLALNSVEVLFAAGLALDSMAPLRTLVELLIDLTFIWSDDTDARTRLYTEYVHVLNLRTLQAHEGVFGPLDAARAATAFAEIASHAPLGVTNADEMRTYIENERKRVSANYPDKRQWHLKNARQRAEAVGLVELYDLVHRCGSEASHSSPTALSRLADIGDNAISVVCTPTVPDEVMPLADARWCPGWFAEHDRRHGERCVGHEPLRGCL
jgi:hypothetical protein